MATFDPEDRSWDSNHTDFRLSNKTLDFQRTLLDSLYPKGKRVHKTADEVFAELDVEPGDRIRLTRGTQSSALETASLEGVVKSIKHHGGTYKVQIDGFDVAGNNIFWPVRDYTVTVVQRGFRWTDDDRLLVAAVGLNPKTWENNAEAYRENTRRNYANRLAALKEAVAKINEISGGK